MVGWISASLEVNTGLWPKLIPAATTMIEVVMHTAESINPAITQVMSANNVPKHTIIASISTNNDLKCTVYLRRRANWWGPGIRRTGKRGKRPRSAGNRCTAGLRMRTSCSLALSSLSASFSYFQSTLPCVSYPLNIENNKILYNKTISAMWLATYKRHLSVPWRQWPAKILSTRPDLLNSPKQQKQR